MARDKNFLASTEIAEVVKRAIPKGPNDFGIIGNEPVFRLCQYLKGIVPEGTVSDELHGVILQWWENSKQILITNGFDDFTTVWIMFVDLWDTPGKIKFPKRDSFRTAKGRAEMRTENRPELSPLQDEKLVDLAHVCYELQQLNGEEPFFLSGKDAGTVIGKCQKRGRLALKYLQSRSIIVKVKDGHTGKSAEYRYIAKLSSNGKSNISQQIQQFKETGDI